MYNSNQFNINYVCRELCPVTRTKCCFSFRVIIVIFDENKYVRMTHVLSQCSEAIAFLRLFIAFSSLFGHHSHSFFHLLFIENDCRVALFLPNARSCVQLCDVRSVRMYLYKKKRNHIKSVFNLNNSCCRVTDNMRRPTTGHLFLFLPSYWWTEE